MAAKLVTLALCCALASASAPTNFKAAFAGTKDGMMNVKLQWDPAGCRSWDPAQYDVYYSANEQDWKWAGRTKGNMLILSKLNYWTAYNFQLSTKCQQNIPDVYTEFQIAFNTPTNFKATRLGDGTDGAFIELTWDKVWCNKWTPAKYRVGGNGDLKGISLHGNSYGLRVDYWTKHRFTLVTDCVENSPAVETSINIGPGEPKRPVLSGVYAESDTVTFSIDPPKASRVPDWYNVTLCRQYTHQCLISYTEKVDSNFKGLRKTINDLEPYTEYILEVTAIIEFGGKTYTSTTKQGFTTREVYTRDWYTTETYTEYDYTDTDLYDSSTQDW